jgi:hypothetical protein
MWKIPAPVNSAKGYLTDEARSDSKAIKAAIEALKSQTWRLGRAELAPETFGKTITENRKLAGDASHSLYRSGTICRCRGSDEWNASRRKARVWLLKRLGAEADHMK